MSRCVDFREERALGSELYWSASSQGGARLSGATSPIKIGHHRIVDPGGQIAKNNKKFFNLALRKKATPIFLPYAL